MKMPVSQVYFLGTSQGTREIHGVFPKGAFSSLHKENAEQDKFTSAKEEKMRELLSLCACCFSGNSSVSAR